MGAVREVRGRLRRSAGRIGAESSLHWKLERGSEEENSKVGVGSLVTPEGPESMVVVGAGSSTVNERETRALSLPAASIASTEKACGPWGASVSCRARRTVKGARVDPAGEGRTGLVRVNEKRGLGLRDEAALARPPADARRGDGGLGRKGEESVKGGLRGPVMREQAGGAAAEALVDVGGARVRVTPKEPVQALGVPGASVGEDQREGLGEHARLALRAQVRIAIGGRRSPPELGDPERRCPVAVARHHARICWIALPTSSALDA